MIAPAHLQIMRIVSAGGTVTRAGLMAQTGLSKAAVSGLARELLDRGLLREASRVQKQGRPSAVLELAPEGAYFIGVSMMTDPARIALVDLRGGVIARIEFPRSPDPADFVAGVTASLARLEGQTGIGRDRITGIGVALSGLVDAGQQVCIRSTIMGWKDVGLAALIAQATGLPCHIENDAKALALAERLFGEARDTGDFSLIWLGSGIGAAHFVGGRLYRGAHGGAGEIAHVTIDPEGLPCRCGKTGCLDTLASLIAILEGARAAGIEADDLAGIEAAAEAGNADAIRLLHRAGFALGLAVAQIIQINDPQLVLVTHREAAFNGLFQRVMQQAIEAHVLPSIAGATPIRIRRINEGEWVQSAASVATHRFLNGQLSLSAQTTKAE